MNNNDYLSLSNKLEDCIPLLKRVGTRTDEELLRTMFWKYYEKYNNLKNNTNEIERNPSKG